MFAFVGTLAVITAFVGGVWLTVAGIQEARSESVDAGALTRPVQLLVGGAVGGLIVLEAAILANDFSLAYLADHHSVTTPFPYNIATAWAALEGSIILWGLILAGYIWLVFRSFRREADQLGAGALAVLGLISMFFFGLMLTVSNPFEVCVQAAARSCLSASPLPWAAAVAPVDGTGPNPLLQNHWMMAIHPPMLYLGYVGLSVPFAYAMSALGLTIPGAEWLRRSQRWTLVAWSFLTIGIVLGGWWAYEILSWGGYWAWDPVENASFMPWLVATAFLHSSLVQQRRGMLQSWNFVLVIGAFSLTILGTFLTRSGIINSVHSFTQSAIGPALLGFLALILMGSFTLFALRSHLIAQSPRLESLSSREGAFLLNNLLLTVYAFVVLVGTMYPMLVEAFSSETVGVGRPFYDRVAVPLSFALLLAMGIGPVMPWRVARPSLVWERTRLPLNIALLAGAATVFTTSRLGYVVIAVVIGVFIITVIVRQLYVAAARGAAGRGSSLPAEVKRTLTGDAGYWGGQISHVGVALIAVAIAFASNLSAHVDRVVMEPGDTVQFAGYELTYIAPFTRQEANKLVEGARIRVDRGGSTLAEVEPRLNRFEVQAFAIGTPVVLTRPGEDLYITLQEVDARSVTLDLDTSPLQWLMWLGGAFAAFGGFWSMRGRRARSRERSTARV